MKYNLYTACGLADAIAHAVVPEDRTAILCDSILFITDKEPNTDGYVNATRYCINKETDELIYAGTTDTSFNIDGFVDVNTLHFDFVIGGIKCWFYDNRMIVDASYWSTTEIRLVPRR